MHAIRCKVNAAARRGGLPESDGNDVCAAASFALSRDAVQIRMPQVKLDVCVFSFLVGRSGSGARTPGVGEPPPALGVTLRARACSSRLAVFFHSSLSLSAVHEVTCGTSICPLPALHRLAALALFRVHHRSREEGWEGTVNKCDTSTPCDEQRRTGEDAQAGRVAQPASLCRHYLLGVVALRFAPRA